MQESSSNQEGPVAMEEDEDEEDDDLIDLVDSVDQSPKDGLDLEDNDIMEEESVKVSDIFESYMEEDGEEDQAEVKEKQKLEDEIAKGQGDEDLEDMREAEVVENEKMEDSDEQGQEVLFSDRGTLFRFIFETKKWRPKGHADFKVLKHRQTDKFSFLMKEEQVSHYIVDNWIYHLPRYTR